MNKIIANFAAKKALELSKAAEENVTLTRRVFFLEIAVALLGGIVIGMFLSPRKNTSYTIASNNRIKNNDDEDIDDEYPIPMNNSDEDAFGDNFDDESDFSDSDLFQTSGKTKSRSKFIKL